MSEYKNETGIEPRYAKGLYGKGSTFLGTSGEYDLWACEQGVGGLTVIARYGNEGPEYTSGLATAWQVLLGGKPRYLDGGHAEWPESSLVLGEALRRAIEGAEPLRPRKAPSK